MLTRTRDMLIIGALIAACAALAAAPAIAGILHAAATIGTAGQ